MKRLTLSILCIAFLAGYITLLSARYGAKATPANVTADASCPATNPKAYPVKAAPGAPAATLATTTDTATLYAQLSILTNEQRKEFYAGLTGVEQARLWSFHFTAFALDRNLKPEQEAFVNEVVTALKGADLDRDKQAMLVRFAGAKDRAIALFGKTDAWELVAHLGGASPFGPGQQPVRVFKSGLTFQTGPNCVCAVIDNWCGGAVPCGCSCSCKFTNAGCGWLWLESSTGLCVSGPCPPCIH